MPFRFTVSRRGYAFPTRYLRISLHYTPPRQRICAYATCKKKLIRIAATIHFLPYRSFWEKNLIAVYLTRRNLSSPRIISVYNTARQFVTIRTQKSVIVARLLRVKLLLCRRRVIGYNNAWRDIKPRAPPPPPRTSRIIRVDRMTEQGNFRGPSASLTRAYYTVVIRLYFVIIRCVYSG